MQGLNLMNGFGFFVACYKSLLVAILTLGFLLPGISFAEAEKNKSIGPKKKIYMVLFRGETEAEKGFVKYFEEHKIPVEIIVRDCENDKNKIPEFVKEIRQIRPDLIYAFGTTVAQEIAGTTNKVDPAKHITDIPIIFNIVADPVGGKLVEKLESSGRNVTGVSHIVPLNTQIKALRSVKDFTRLGILYNPAESNAVAAVKQLEKLAKEEKFVLVPAPIKLGADGKPDADSIPSVIDSLAAQQPGVIYLPSDSFVISKADEIGRLINDRKIPSFSATEAPIRKSGVFMGLVSPYYIVGKFAGYKAEQILLEGKKAKDLPIETLKRFSFLVNMHTANKIGVYPPLNVLKFAEVIKEAKGQEQALLAP